MKLFISWSGERSKAMALALRDWFPLVLHYAEPWLSEADIEAGSRWADEVAGQLEASNFGIICVTRENMAAPWILFEAGALAKSIQGSRVVPLLLDLDFREISGPLAQFQAKKVEKEGLLDTVQSINQAAVHPVPDERYRQLFEALWNDLKKRMDSIPQSAMPHKQSRTQTEVLEELVTAVRTMEARAKDNFDEPRPNKKRRFYEPKMAFEMSQMLSDGPGDPVYVLVAASFFKEDAPWLYELGMNAYRLAESGEAKKFRAAKQRFMRGMELITHGPFRSSEMHPELKMAHMLVRDMMHMMDHEFEPDRSGESSARRKLGDVKP